MTSDGSALTRLRRALAAQNLMLVRVTAAELGYVALADALAILELIEAQDQTRFEPAAVRWAGRLAIEAPALRLEQLRLAIDALGELPGEPARATLLELARDARPRPVLAPAPSPRSRGGRRWS